jgi:multisubunit Na+/H+ antiporter MnhB subunit
VGGIFGITALLVLIYLWERPKLKKNGRKIKVVFFTLLTIGWLLAILLVLFPNMPGPSQLIDFIFKPFGRYWEIN